MVAQTAISATKVDEGRLFKQISVVSRDAIADAMGSKEYAEKLASGFKSSNFDTQIASVVKKAFGDRTKTERNVFAKDVKTEIMSTLKDTVTKLCDRITQVMNPVLESPLV